MDTYLRGTILKTPTSEPIPRGLVRVRDGRIEAILPASSEAPTERTIDFGDCFVIPGLIDSHCHLVYRGDGHWSNGYLETTSPERLLLIAAANAQRALRAGITTLRDLGGPTRLLLELRSAGEDDEMLLPRLLCSGAPLTPTGGHGWDLGGEVDSSDGMVRSIRRLAREGVDVIKVMASGGGTPGTCAGRPSFKPDDLRLMAETAHDRHLPIVAHATCPEAIRCAAEAGFDGIEHGGFWEGDDLTNRYDEKVSEILAEQGTFFAPTLQASYRTFHELAGQTAEERLRRQRLLDDTFRNFRRMLVHDIRWVAGSDAGYMLNPFGDLVLGLRLMVGNGMTAAEALASSTVRSAAALGLSDRVGRLEPGLDADIVVTEGNPLEDITACGRIRAVFRRGCQVPVRLPQAEKAMTRL